MVKIKKHISKIISFIICIAILISVPIISLKGTKKAGADDKLTVLTVWQIDNFEGGKGSRASYLKSVASKFSESYDCFLNIVSLNAEAAKINLDAGTVPDLISYGAGIFGIENYIRDFTVWCRGGYCLLSVTESADFSDVTTENTVINTGVGNFAAIAATFNGLSGAIQDKPTGAYVKLINGDFKYLLGTQRDIYRLKTRGVSFAVKAITNFNDLYQNISIVTTDKKRAFYSEKFIGYLLDKSEGLTSLGLMLDGKTLYDDEMHELETVKQFDYKIAAPISYETKTSLEAAISFNDENKLKNLLK